jgi:hypothetical protein
MIVDMNNYARLCLGLKESGGGPGCRGKEVADDCVQIALAWSRNAEDVGDHRGVDNHVRCDSVIGDGVDPSRNRVQHRPAAMCATNWTICAAFSPKTEYNAIA